MSDWTRKPFFINSTSSTFLDWCWHYAQDWFYSGRACWLAPCPLTPPSDDPEGPLDWSRAEVRMIGGGYRGWAVVGGNVKDSFEVEGFEAVPYKDRDVETSGFAFPIIELHTTPLASERCEVEAVCRFEPALPLYEELLQAIAERWPESALAQGGGHRAGKGRAILTLKIPAPSGSPKPLLAEWRFTVETETPAYFWNRVISHIVRHNRRLETQEHGPLLLDVGDGPKHPHPDPETAIIEAHHALLAVVLNSIDPDQIPSEAEIRAFFDPDNPERPRTLHLPKRAQVFFCSILALGDRRLSVHLQTWLPEAIPYITAMLPELGYPEIARQIEIPLQQPPEPEPAQVGAQSQGAEARSDSRAGGRPPKTELTPEDEKATREYLARIGKGTPKKAAAELGGHAYETFERWAKLLGE